MEWIARQCRLKEKAEKDQIYCAWRQSFLAVEKEFAEFADHQPEEIRQILWQYVQSSTMMQQRMVNLACIHMVFPEEE